MARLRDRRRRFQCPACGFGDYEVGHLVGPDETYCIVCLEEDGRQILVETWVESGRDRARFNQSSPSIENAVAGANRRSAARLEGHDIAISRASGSAVDP